MKNFFIVSNDIFSLHLSAPQFMVYCYLCRCQDRKTRQAYPSLHTMARACGLAASTISKAVKQLAALKLIRIESRYEEQRGKRRRTNNRYHIAESVKGTPTGGQGDGSGWPLPCLANGQEINQQDSVNDPVEQNSSSKEAMISEQIQVNRIRPSHMQEAVIKILDKLSSEDISQLDTDTVQFAVDRFLEVGSITNETAYMRACLHNAADNYDLHLSKQVAETSR